MLRQQTSVPIEPEQITLELLQSYYNVPLAELAKELGLSLTLLKKICRKFGIQRWPHRQIRSINKNIQDLNERLNSVNSTEELVELKNQISLLEKKRRLVTKGASSGLHTAVRNAIFLANPEHLEEESMFDGLNSFNHFPTPIQQPSARAKPHSSLDKLKMRMYPNRSPMIVGQDIYPNNHLGFPTHPTNNMFSMGQTFNQPMQPESNMGLSQAQMMQIIMQQQMQMNNFMCQQPAQNIYEPQQSSNEAIPFFEIAAMLENSEDEAEMNCPLFDTSFTNDTTFSSMETNYEPQILPSSMTTGNNIFSEEHSSHLYGVNNHFNAMNMESFQSL